MTATTLPTTSVLPLVEIHLDNDLDIGTLPALREKITDALSLHPKLLVLDFSRCRYLDAQAISVLLETNRAAWRSGGRLVLRACSEPTVRLLALAGVLRVFELEGSEQGLPA
jgi:anti-anti-sigma factor